MAALSAVGNIAVTYVSGVDAVHDTSFTVAEGELVALDGASHIFKRMPLSRLVQPVENCACRDHSCPRCALISLQRSSQGKRWNLF